MAELIPLFLIVMYIVPFCVAVARAHHNAGAILAVNFLFGWTIIGWIAAIGWAAFGPAETAKSRSRDAQRYATNTSEDGATMPRILHNFTD